MSFQNNQVIDPGFMVNAVRKGQDIPQAQQAAAAGQAQQQQLAMFFNNLASSVGEAAGKESVPSVNRHQETGHGGLVDPSLVEKQTMLAQERRMDQMKNYAAIQNSLPPQLQQLNTSLL